MYEEVLEVNTLTGVTSELRMRQQFKVFCAFTPFLIVPTEYCVSTILMPIYKASISVDIPISNVSEEFWRYLVMRIWFSAFAAIISGFLVSWVAWKINQYRYRPYLYLIPFLYVCHSISLSVSDYVSHYATYYDVLIQSFHGMLMLFTIHASTKFFEAYFPSHNRDALQ